MKAQEMIDEIKKLKARVSALEASGSYSNVKYGHIYREIETLDVGRSADFEMESETAARNAASCIGSKFKRGKGKAFRTVSHESGLCVVRIA